MPTSLVVSPHQASNLALLFHELTTNVCKYALAPGRQKAQVDVRFHQAAGVLTIVFADNGPGYPPDVLQQGRQGVGLYLLKRVVEATLHGSLTLTNDGGAVATLYIRSDVPELRT